MKTWASHCWSVQTAPAPYTVRASWCGSPCADDLPPRCEVQPAVVDDERRREDEQEDEPEAGEEDDEDVLLLRDAPEASLPDRPGVRHGV